MARAGFAARHVHWRSRLYGKNRGLKQERFGDTFVFGVGNCLLKLIGAFRRRVLYVSRGLSLTFFILFVIQWPLELERALRMFSSPWWLNGEETLKISRQPWRGKMDINRLHLDLSDDCNLVCSYCFVRKDKKTRQGSMTANSWIRVVRQAVALGINRFVVSGGEPLILPGFIDILRVLEECGSSVSLMTNWVGADEETRTVVKQSPAVKEITISWDGFDGHDLTRPPSKWRDVQHGLVELRTGPPRRLVVNTVVHSSNLSELPGLQRAIVEIGIDCWRLDVPIRPVSGTFMPHLRAVVEAGASLIKERYADESLQRLEMVLFRIYKSRLEGVALNEAAAMADTELHPCDYFLGRLTIRPDGTVSMCSPFQHSLGKLDAVNVDLRVVLSAVSAHSFFNLRVNQIGGCGECRYLGLCGSGCRADALRWTGRMENPDPVSCAIMPLVEEIVLPVLSPRLCAIYRGLIREDGLVPVYDRFVVEGR